MTIPSFSSVYGEASAEYIIKKSRFIASLKEVKSDTEAASFIESVRKHYWDARHNCYAYQIGPAGRLQKSSDDGEPAGTAGRPMLEILKKEQITNTVVVVTRYFGGIKLGASGLIRAYSHTVALGLAAAQIADYIPFSIMKAQISYSYVSLMERTAQDRNIIICSREFLDKVTFTLQIPLDSMETWKTEWTNATSGTTIFTDMGIQELPVIRTKKEADF